MSDELIIAVQERIDVVTVGIQGPPGVGNPGGGSETTTTLGALINGATAKAVPVDADMLPLMDSAASNIVKKLSWANVKATLKAYFDTLYQPLAAVLTATTAAFTTAQEIKLAGIATGATANSSDATLLARANHTGTQAQSTVVNLVTDLAAKAPLASPALTGTPTAPTPAGGTNTTQLPTTAWVLSEISSAVAGLLDLKGNTDCSSNPNYPAASKGDTYYVSVAGKIGGASGVTVAVGDAIICKADNAGGTEASVGTSWFVLEKNLAGALLSANNLSDVADAATARSNIGANDAANLSTGNIAAARMQTNLKAALEAVSQTFNSTNTTIDGGTL